MVRFNHTKLYVNIRQNSHSCQHNPGQTNLSLAVFVLFLTTKRDDLCYNRRVQSTLGIDNKNYGNPENHF